MSHLEKKISYFEKGEEKELTLGKFMRELMKRMSARLFNPIRFVTASFDRSYIGSQEKEQYKNIITMRNFIKDLIIAKREEIKANP